MADINQIITLGIGTPAGIEEFILFGLQPHTVAHSEAPAERTLTIAAESREYDVEAETRTFEA